jgi:pimeloyl-ACP methyl ester carboxylesterase
MAERMIEANGVELCTEPFGDPSDPPTLLVMGISGSTLWWDEGLCQRFADRDRFVIPRRPSRSGRPGRAC